MDAEHDWASAQQRERRRLRGMVAATAAFGVISWVMIAFLNNSKASLLMATGCLSAICLASIWTAMTKRIGRPELRSFLYTLALWTGLAGLMTLTGALIA
jgi:hypothetical protein